LAYKIALAGKGGCGKTSIAALAVRYLLHRNMTPVLAVDADPNANFGESLGLQPKVTIGSILNDFQHEKIDIPAGMTKESYLEYKLNTTVTESKGLDLVTMGRGQGPDCYCYPNTVLKKFIEGLSDSYRFVVMDNEAGLEHLSRKTTEDVDLMLLVSNHSVKGIRSIARVQELIEELKLPVKKQVVIINMVPVAIDELVLNEMKNLKIKADIVVPEDDALFRFDLGQKPLTGLPDNSPAVQAVDALLDNYLNTAAKPL